MDSPSTEFPLYPRELCRDDSPAPGLSLANHSYSDLFSFWPRSVDDPHQNTRIPKHSDYVAVAGSSTGKATGPSRALGNNVFFVQQSTGEAGADKIVSY